MKPLRSHLLWSLLIGQTLILSAWAQDPAAHNPAIHASAGLNKALTAGITEGDFLKLGDQPKTVKVTLVAAFTDANYGMNFDGYSHGKATFTIPTGWKVEVTFINPSPVPHSVVAVERDAVRKLQVGDPAFVGASTPNPVIGISASKATFTFTASEAGDYAFACGFPSHALAGHWVALQISNEAKAPTLKLGDAPAQDAK
jgi:sulfocyanin